ncbi:maltose alpha-D-glucosyltransferase/ alpha-amylase, partial [Actinomadura mexicana]
LVQDGGVLRGVGPGVRRFQRRRLRRPARADLQARPSAMARRGLPMAAAHLPVAVERRRLRHRRVHEDPARLRGAGRFRGPHRRSPCARDSCDRGSGDEPHQRPAPVVPGVADRSRRALRRLLHVGRRRHRLPRRPHHLRRHRSIQLDLRPGPRPVLLAPLLHPPARPQLRQPRRPGRHAGEPAVLAGPGHRRIPPGRRPLPVRPRRHQLREPPRNPRLPQTRPRRGRPPLPRPRPARRGQPVARRRRGVLRRPRRRRRRMPHGLPLPRHAPHLHGRTPRAALPHLRDHGPDPQDPRQLPMGHLPAQPRRTHPGDGHRRRTRLHVHRIRQRPPHESQHRHPPPPGPPAGQRPQPTRTVHRAPAVPARLPRPVLRRRDRHGRQHLARRPRRRQNPHAMDTRPQRRILHLRPRTPLPAGHHGPHLRLPGRQRRGPDQQPRLPAPLDPQNDRDPPAPPRLRRRLLRRTVRLQPLRPRLHPRD